MCRTAICLTMGAVLAVVTAQLLFNSLQTFFTLVLSAAGFFLVLEFFLDSVTALVFLSRVRTGHFQRLPGHHYGALRAGAAATAAIYLALMVGFFVVGPKAIGGPIDLVLAVSLAAGLVFTFASRHRPEPFQFDTDTGADEERGGQPSTPTQAQTPASTAAPRH